MQAAQQAKLFGNPAFPATAAAWASQHAIPLARLWPPPIIAMFLPLSTKKFRTLGD